MSAINIIPLPEKPADERMIRVELTIPRGDLDKLHAFMAGDTWEKAEAVRKGNLTQCLKSMEIALTVATRHYGTSGGRVFATLLASMYNGNRVKFDVSDLKSLDRENFEHALNCMRLCQELHREPHTFFEDGGDLFEQMIADWGLEKKKRRAA